MNRHRILVVLAGVLVAFGVGWGARGLVGSPPVGHEGVGHEGVGHEGHDEAAHGGHEQTYTCAMHPQIKQEGPGTCPLCGMALIPMAEAEHGDEDDPVVRLSDRARALARLRTEVVGGPGAGGTRTLTGRLTPAEDRRTSVVAWSAGRIEALRVRASGERVREGQVVAEIYSPAVMAAHGELVAARAQVARLGGAEGFGARALGAAEERLRLLGVPEDRLDALASQAAPLRRVPIRSPFRGTVLDVQVTEGEDVREGQTLLRLADLRVVWGVFDAYPDDFAVLREGVEVQIEVDGLSSPVPGEVDLVEPVLDPTRRTGRVRVAIPNPDGRLRPGSLAQVRVPVEVGEDALSVPYTAVYQTGKRALVYVEDRTSERPGYRAREVQIGPRVGDRVPIRAGLAAGERVVVHGAFVLDADLQLRGARSLLTLPDAPDPYADVLSLSGEARRRWASILRAYLEVQTALARDDLDGAKAGARALAQAPPVSDDGEVGEAWARGAARLTDTAKAIGTAADLGEARAAFLDLVDGIAGLLGSLGNPLEEPVHLAYCPMTGEDGAYWVQQGARVENAHQGSKMLRCGEIREVVAPNTPLRSWP